MNKPKYLFVIVAAIFLFILPKSVSATTVASSSISSDTVWTVAESPYLLVGVVSVEPGTTLTVEAGAAIKATRFGALEVSGSLRVSGATSTPVIFTSYHDDTVGGDTNGNGADSLPAGGDWMWVKFLPGSSGSVERAEFRYGGYEWRTGATDGQIIVDGASPVLRNVLVHDGHIFGKCLRLTNSQAQVLNSDFSGSYECLRIEGGAPVVRSNSIHGASSAGVAITSDVLSESLVLRDNRIYENTNYGLVSSNAGIVDARLNWWGSDAGPCVGDRISCCARGGDSVSTGDCSEQQAVLGNVLYDPWVGKAREPVVLIPGIMGSWEKRGRWVIDPILHTYDNLLEALRAEGYRDGETLFTFPYDWKISNVLTAHYLRDRLAEVRAICNCTKVDLVAHSMGGLIARQYISSSEYADDVDQIIFLGTPHRGAPQDYLAWEAGEMGPTAKDLLLEKLLGLQGLHLSYTNLFDYIHNYPISTVRELLPIYNYLRNASDSTVRPYSHCESRLNRDTAIPPCLYPTNEFLEVLNSEEKLTNLQNSHVRFVNIIGDTFTNETINMLRVESGNCEPSEATPQPCLWQHGKPQGYNQTGGDHGLELGSGDNTVPLASATHFNVAGSEELTLNSNHSALPTAAQEEILEKLTGAMPSSSVNTWRVPNTFLLVRVFSPVDIQITDPQGRRIGQGTCHPALDAGSTSCHCDQTIFPEPIEGQSNCGTELSEIPGAFYSGSDTENEFIFIPDPLDGEYQIQTQGTGAGEFRIVTSLVYEANDTECRVAPAADVRCRPTEAEYTNATTVNQIQELTLNLNASSSTPTLALRILEPSPEEQFVRRDGAKLMLAGEEFKPLGANYFELVNTHIERCGSGPVDSNLYGQILENLKQATDSNTLRLFAFQSFAGASGADFFNFDTLVAAAKASGIHLIFALEAQQKDYCSGNIPNRKGSYKYVDWYENGYRAPYDGYALSYRDYVAALVEHFKDEPTIMMWELVHGMEGKNSRGRSAPQALVSFVEDIGNLIKQIDQNHLIALGTAGADRPGTKNQDFIALSSLAQIDVVEAQDWESRNTHFDDPVESPIYGRIYIQDARWKWYDITRWQHTQVGAWLNLEGRIPSGAAMPIRRVGYSFNNLYKWQGELFLDDAQIGNEFFDFESADFSRINLQGRGIESLSQSAEQASQGANSLKIKLSGQSGTLFIVPTEELTRNDLVRFRIYTSEAAPPLGESNPLGAALRVAKNLNKPFIVSAAGLKINCRSRNCVTMSERAEIFSSKIESALRNGVSGYLLWNYIYTFCARSACCACGNALGAVVNSAFRFDNYQFTLIDPLIRVLKDLY